ncbi:fatty acid desaturase [Pseudonocardia bannensis]|uniref:fatty acid desaturase n=1 Tax=Pseudonocardia bannensis TaxID=630973 RepID=UPI001B7CE85C|nr:fatty acid desaturase [Pseudonocardia bannensis]
MTTSPIDERVRLAGDGPVLSEAESRAVRRGVPDPGIPLPPAATPTLTLFFGSLVVWGVATWLALGEHAPFWVTIPLHALVTFTMFTVLHDAIHHAAGRMNWVNEVFGRLSVPFVACYASFGMFRFIHIEHHRNTNEDIDTDPDAWTTHGPWWQLPLRWLSIDGRYAVFYLRRLRTRPRGERLETMATVGLTLLAFGGLIATGHGWELALIYLIPQRIGVGVLAWWFDWMPHHGLTATARQNRFAATRVRVGMEWLLTPVMLYQNYHLVHHLHPAIPFYRYVKAWQRNEKAYLSRDVPIMTAWGRELTASEYRAWRRLTASFHSEEAPGSTAETSEFHPLTVAEVRPLTADSVSISFEIPESLRERFRFTPGQHLTLRTTVDGAEIRRTYSLCTSATSDLVRIAVKRIDGGAMSRHLTQEIAAGDVLEVAPPSGRFTLHPASAKGRHHVGIAAGSGITPIISMLSTALTEHEDSRFTLLYGNRTAESTMFRDELEMLARQFEGRLRIVHFRSEATDSEPGSGFERIVCGRMDTAQLTSLFDDAVSPREVDGWFLCGPQQLVDDTRALLTDHAVPAELVHVELFHAEPARALDAGVASTITATAGGRTSAVDTDGHESVLEAVLRGGLDAPYACMGGACGTCRAKLVRGTAEMELNYALGADELAAGYVLTCQSRPTSERVELDYDA